MEPQESLKQQHASLRRRYESDAGTVEPAEITAFLAALQRAREATEETTQREELETWQRYWERRTATPSPRSRRRLPLWAMLMGGTVVLILAALGISRILVQDLNARASLTPPTVEQGAPPAATPLPTRPLPTPTSTPAASTASATAPTPIPTGEAPTTATTTLTATAPTTITLPAPTAAPQTQQAYPIDPVADIVPLTGGATVADPPTGLDITSCSIATDTTVLTTLAPPTGTLTVTEITTDTLTVWLTLVEPVPANRALNYHWLVALDVDNDSTTGRPAGDGYINPELGTEIGAGVFLYPNGNLEPYIYIWSPVIGDWAGDTPDIVSVELSEARDAVAFTFPLEELRTSLSQIADVEYDPTTLHGRVGAIASSQTEPAVVDFCPDLP